MTSTDNTIAQMKSRALSYDCPFCPALAGEPCRTRNSGREQDWPHSRRIARTTPPDGRYQATYVDALCCVCGCRRQISSDYHRYNDPNYGDGAEGKRKGWRRTQTLKCDECSRRTRHAILCGNDYDERILQYVLGGEWSGQYPPDRDRLRAEYFAQFPRNPKLLSAVT